MSVVLAVIGLVLVVQSFTRGGEVLSARLLIGVLLATLGVGRSYIELRRTRASARRERSDRR
jgi:hypothetical protein